MLCEQEDCLIEDKWQDMVVSNKVKAGRYEDHWLTITKVNKRSLFQHLIASLGVIMCLKSLILNR